MSKKLNYPSPTDLFDRFVPPQAVIFCVDLFSKNKFTFKVTPPRKTKLGDYQYDFTTKKHTITVNSDLNKYSFLITYIHEVAHLLTMLKHGRHVNAHGDEWKNEYSLLLLECLKTGAFPTDLEKTLISFIKSPKASTSASVGLMTALSKYDIKQALLLSSIIINQRFYLNGEEYIKIEKRRTRSICVRTSDKKKFLVSEIAEVKTSL